MAKDKDQDMSGILRLFHDLRIRNPETSVPRSNNIKGMKCRGLENERHPPSVQGPHPGHHNGTLKEQTSANGQTGQYLNGQTSANGQTGHYPNGQTKGQAGQHPYRQICANGQAGTYLSTQISTQGHAGQNQNGQISPKGQAGYYLNGQIYTNRPAGFYQNGHSNQVNPHREQLPSFNDQFGTQGQTEGRWQTSGVEQNGRRGQYDPGSSYKGTGLPPFPERSACHPGQNIKTHKISLGQNGIKDQTMKQLAQKQTYPFTEKVQSYAGQNGTAGQADSTGQILKRGWDDYVTGHSSTCKSQAKSDHSDEVLSDSDSANALPDEPIVGENQSLGVKRVKAFLQGEAFDYEPDLTEYDIKDVDEVILRDEEVMIPSLSKDKMKRQLNMPEATTSKHRRLENDIWTCRNRLSQSIEENDIEETRIILHEYSGTEAFQEFLNDGGEQDLLRIATCQNNVALLKLLLGYGLDPNTDCEVQEGPLKVYKTPVHLAATQGSLQVLRVLLAHPGVKVDKLSTKGMSPLHHAVKQHIAPDIYHGEKFDRSAVILILLGAGASIELKDSGGGKNFFHHLVETGDINLMRNIFSHYERDEVTAFLNTKTKSNDTCYQLAHRFIKHQPRLFDSLCELLKEYNAECKPYTKKH